MDAASLKSALRSLLGDAGATDGWDAAVLDEALAQGLADTNVWLPPVETVQEVTAAGCEQDLAGLSPWQVLAVAHPWDESKRFRDCAVTWRMVNPTTIRLDGHKLNAGELLRVRYRKRCTVAGIGGETITSLPAGAERMLLPAAAAHAYLIRYRQLSRRPSSAPGELQACKELAEVYRKQFEGAICLAAETMPAWGEIGL